MQLTSQTQEASCIALVRVPPPPWFVSPRTSVTLLPRSVSRKGTLRLTSTTLSSSAFSHATAGK